MKYLLIQTNPLQIVSKPVNGFPTRRERDNLDGCQAPDGHAYIPDLPKPTEAAEGKRWTRKLTADAHGWEQIDYEQPDDAELFHAGVTKLTIMRRLQELGKWTMFKGLLAQLPEDTQDAWSLAQEIHDDDPMFLTYADGIKLSLDLTDEQFTALLTP